MKRLSTEIANLLTHTQLQYLVQRAKKERYDECWKVNEFLKKELLFK